MSTPPPTRTVIASNQAIFLRGLESLLLKMPDFQLLGEAHSAMEIIQLVQLTRPDMVVLDLHAENVDENEVARQLLQERTGLQIVLLVPSLPTAAEVEDDRICYCSRHASEDDFRSAMQEANQHLRFGKKPLRAIPQSASESNEAEDRFERPVRHRDEEVLARELVMAGRIQADIMPEEPPLLAGWEISARLEPARETSGDFYDFIPLTDHKLGVAIADVTDKGMGAALFMALSSSLLRTYANRFPTLPAFTLSSVSERILSDTRGSMFVTAFYGVLEPHTGRFTYANAGHPAGYLVTRTKGRMDIQVLRPTGMALGVSDQAQWKQKMVRINPGDLLILYTDGITEAENARGEFFDEDRIFDAILSKPGLSAVEIQNALLEEVHRFAGPATQSDDIALIVIKRLV